jgi:UDP-GlcNAc:undecaprenyl-phosphate GlcNAc-1-phosphate transferase
VRTFLIAFFMAAAVVVALTPFIRAAAARTRAVDLPGSRRVNKRVVPRLGGVAILAGFFAPLIGLLFLNNDIAVHFQENLSRAMAALCGAAGMAVLGAIDDFKGLRARYKLVFELFIACAAWLAGFRIDELVLPFFGSFETGWLSLPLTVAWIVGIINAVNLIDGLDGLAAGVAFMVCVVNFVVGFMSDHLLVALFSSALGGAVLGFLVFNFNPARIFMGDSGSMFIGYVLAITSLVGSKGSTAVALLVPILALGVPIMDTLFAIARRLSKRRPLFAPDGEHIHHRLLRRGLTHRRAVLTLYGVSVVLTVAALVVYIGRDWEVGVTLLVASAVLFGLIRAVSSFRFRKLADDQGSNAIEERVSSVRLGLPRYLDALGRVRGASDLRRALGEFGNAAGLQTIVVKTKAASPWVWRWDRDHLDCSERTKKRNEDAPPIKIELSCGPAASIEFGWFADHTEVPAKIEVLLKVVATETGTKIASFGTDQFDHSQELDSHDKRDTSDTGSREWN